MMNKKDMSKMEPITVIMEDASGQETCNKKVSRNEVYNMFMKQFGKLEKAVNCFILEDEQCDAVKIFWNKKNNEALIVFSTWDAGVPEDYTYNEAGDLLAWYNEENGTVIYKNINNDNMEEEEMNNTNTTTQAQDIWVKMQDNAKKAIEFGLTEAHELKKFASTMSAMSPEQAESYCRKQFNMSCKKFFEFIEVQLNIELKRSEDSDKYTNFGDESEVTTGLKKALANLKTAMQTGEKHGWAKAKDVLKALFGLAFALFIEIAKVVLKLVFTIAVGVIKIGATAVTTLLSCADVIGNDVVKPVASAAKKAHTEIKGRKASKNVGVGVI